MGAVLAGIHGSLGFMAPWITIPFIISGLVVTYLWVVRESKFMMAFLTSLASGILAYSFFGTTPEQGITILKVLEITSGTMMGGLVGLYHGYTRWFHIRKSLLDQFKQQRMAVLISENEPSVATLHRFCAEFVIPHFQEAKTAVASLLNEAYTSKDSCESGLRILKNQDNKPDFEEFFELHKVRNDHESRIQVLERLYGAYQKLESRLLERMKLLERASESERFQVLSGAVGNAEYLWIADQEVRGEKWKKNLARKRMDLLMTWIENFRPFLEFELHRKELNNLELWTKQIVQKSSGSVA
ncbi:hypothetical protein HOF92_00355 [bacterium]|nr:hypothetical protein [bacterium]